MLRAARALRATEMFIEGTHSEEKRWKHTSIYLARSNDMLCVSTSWYGNGMEHLCVCFRMSQGMCFYVPFITGYRLECLAAV